MSEPRLGSAADNTQGTLQKDDSCRVYRSEFYEAAVTRQNVTHCEAQLAQYVAIKSLKALIRNPRQ
jgi:hypothetical protein